MFLIFFCLIYFVLLIDEHFCYFNICRAQGPLTIRLLLDINETCLRSQGFFDLWKRQKKFENESALASLGSRLAELDALPDDRQRWIELCRGVLAGMMYLYGNLDFKYTKFSYFNF